MPVYVKHFNRILSSGTLPESWLSGTIIPIYKNKGDIKQPENHRPITLLSCLGKLFTSIINQRLTEYIESYNLLNYNQCGFRRNHSTVDNIFVLHILSEYCKIRRTKLFCAFIDFQKAFDSVWRSALWSKLISYNVSGKLFNVIKTCTMALSLVFFVMVLCLNPSLVAEGYAKGKPLPNTVFTVFE